MHLPIMATFVQPHLGISLHPLSSAMMVLFNRVGRNIPCLVCPLLTPVFPNKIWQHFYDAVCQLACPAACDRLIITFSAIQYQHDMKVCLQNSKFLLSLSCTHKCSVPYQTIYWSDSTPKSKTLGEGKNIWDLQLQKISWGYFGVVLGQSGRNHWGTKWNAEHSTPLQLPRSTTRFTT